MNPARRGIESLYDSDTFVSTCTTPEFAPAESSSAPSRKAGGKSIFEVDSGAASSFAVVPERLGRNRGEDTQCAGDPVCVSVLSSFAPGIRTGARVSQASPRKMGETAPGGGIEETCLVH